jgi:hypothetical protein
MRPPFRLLLKLFQNRFFENDTVSPGGGFETNIYQVLGFLVTVGGCVAYLAMPQFLALGVRPIAPETEWLLRILRLFFTAYSFGMAGFAALFYWEALFPDRRDFLILAPFPIRLRDLFAAKLLALVRFLLLLAAAINLAPDLLVLGAMFIPGLHGAGVRLAAVQLAATWGASGFGFLSVVALQGLLVSITSPKVFRRISPWIQMLGMSLMVITMLGFPVYSSLLKRGIEGRQIWLYLFPPIWFSGLYEKFAGGQNELLASLGTMSIEMTTLAILIIAATWGFGFRRQFRRTLEAEDSPHRPYAWMAPRLFARNPQERSILGFIAKTLGRSSKHQFFVATYISAGISVAAFFAIAIRDGKASWSPGGVRAAAFVLSFFLVSGFRTVFQFPAELGANWIFRMTEARWTEVSRSATRKLAITVSVAALLPFVLPLEFAVWDWPVVMEHVVVQVLATALLVEAMFWSFDKVPFTCSYFPGRRSLALLIVVYVYGVSGYSFNLADVESAMERNAGIVVLVFAIGAGAVFLAWRRRPRGEAVRFDGSEPVIQTLELT